MDSVVQGSGLGPATYVVNAADLRPIHPSNELVKYADDTYLIIPAVNNHTSEEEAVSYTHLTLPTIYSV